MNINHDLFSAAGRVRIRASTPDPYAPLGGGGDYIRARGFDKVSPATTHAAAAAKIKDDVRENLAKAINSGRLVKPKHGHFIFETGHTDYSKPELGNRRFYVVRK